jgi:hypothetical protein
LCTAMSNKIIDTIQGKILLPIKRELKGLAFLLL